MQPFTLCLLHFVLYHHPNVTDFVFPKHSISFDQRLENAECLYKKGPRAKRVPKPRGITY